MNPDRVYVRTPEGERLARSPRQISSYAQRATLLLVDGQINVGELLRRFGETLPVEEMLGELEREGLVHPRTAAGELPVEPAPGQSDELPGFGQDPLFDPEVEGITEERLIQEALSEPGPELMDEARREPTLARPDEPARPRTGQAPRAEKDEPESEGALPDPWERASPRLGGLRSKAGVAVLAILGLGLIAGMALWLAGLRPQVEARASAALGVPVSVGSLGLAIRHGPALALNEVSIGLGSPVVLAGVEVIPDPRQGNVWTAARLRVPDASLKPSELSALAGLLGKSEAVTELVFSGLSLRLGELRIGGLEGSLERAADGAMILKLADPAGGLSLEARPDGPGLVVYLAASPGVLPVLGRPKIGTVELRGRVDDAGLRGGELGMTGYGGKFDGTLTVGWAGPVSVDARLRMAAVSMTQLSRSLFERGGIVDGQASGSLAVEARAARWEELTRIDRLAASFTVERGALKGFDLGAALRERSPSPLSGGETRFESLRGRMEAGPREIRLWLDRLDSGALTASGVLTIAGFQDLRGNLSASVQVPGRGALHYPAQVAGTVALPSIQLRLPAGGMAVRSPPDQGEQ
jgi:hypothetical protein